MRRLLVGLILITVLVSGCSGITAQNPLSSTTGSAVSKKAGKSEITGSDFTLNSWVPTVKNVARLDLNLNDGLLSAELQQRGPVEVYPTSATSRALISKLLGWVQQAKPLPQTPMPMPSFGIHALTFVTKSGKAVAVGEYFGPNEAGPGRASDKDVWIETGTISKSGLYRAPDLAKWLNSGWAQDMEQIDVGWTCSDPDPPSGHLNEIGGSFADGTRWIVAADGTHSCVAFYTTSGANWKKSTVATDAFPDGGAYVQQVQFLDPKHAFVLVGSSPNEGRVHRALYATQDGGKTWQSLLNPTTPFPDGDTHVNMRFTSLSFGWLVTLANGQVFVYHTTDGGKAWSITHFSLPGDVNPNDYQQATMMYDDGKNQTIRVVGQWKGDLFFNTNDGGEHWSLEANANG